MHYNYQFLSNFDGADRIRLAPGFGGFGRFRPFGFGGFVPGFFLGAAIRPPFYGGYPYYPYYY